MKILAPAFILLTLLAACDQQSAMGQGHMGQMGMGHEGNETAAMEALEGPGQ